MKYHFFFFSNGLTVSFSPSIVHSTRKKWVWARSFDREKEKESSDLYIKCSRYVGEGPISTSLRELLWCICIDTHTKKLYIIDTHTHTCLCDRHGSTICMKKKGGPSTPLYTHCSGSAMLFWLLQRNESYKMDERIYTSVREKRGVDVFINVFLYIWIRNGHFLVECFNKPTLCVRRCIWIRTQFQRYFSTLCDSLLTIGPSRF